MSTKFCCRACASPNGLLVLDLGTQPLANNLLTPSDLGKPEPKFPLRVAVCTQCWLLQITEIVPPVALFSEYLYFSSFSDTLLGHAQDAAHRYLKEFALGAGSFVVEIASNDGYLLKNFQAASVPCLGIEPAANVARVAQEKGIDTISQFFGEETAKEVAATRGKADLILGNNVFAHAPAINDFVAGLSHLLKPDGTIILEFPYAADLIEHAEFDTIYHEHVFYFTLTALVPLFDRHQLSVFHVERLPIHGGSLRLFLGHKGSRKQHTSVTELLANEYGKGISSTGYYRGFAERVTQLKKALCELLHHLKSEGRSIAAYGASAKGSTLLNYYGLGCDVLDFVADRSTYKQGRLTPGTHIPIVAPDQLLARQPDYTLLLTWNFAEEILAQQKAYRERGGKFIVPVPKVAIR
ncbi:MAG: methyltransferase domain-containing protein [Pedosphaera sp.]|nr:methyltransferase domain-containing protein [Pedosphaera sp.]